MPPCDEQHPNDCRLHPVELVVSPPVADAPTMEIDLLFVRFS